MKVRLSGYIENKFILVQWIMDLKNERESLSFNELKRLKEKGRVVDSFMFIRFDIVGKSLILNELETFKHKHVQETMFMGGREKFCQYIVNYFNSERIEVMLNEIINSSKTRAIYKSELSKFLLKNVKHNESNNKQNNKAKNEYYRYTLSSVENEVMLEQLNYIIKQLEEDNKGYKSATGVSHTEVSNKIIILKNIVNNVKHIEVSDKKTNATLKAINTNKEKSRQKIKKAYEKLKKDGKKITIYAIAKQANVSHSTANKYSEIFEVDLV